MKHASSPKENPAETMDETTTRTMAAESRRTNKKLNNDRKKKQASSPMENPAETVDKTSRAIAPKKEERKKKGMRKKAKIVKTQHLSRKERLAAVVVFEVMDEAVNERCVTKVIESIAKMAKVKLEQTGRFDIPMFLNLTIPPANDNIYYNVKCGLRIVNMTRKGDM